MIDQNPILAEVFQNRTVEHPDGRKLKVTANISQPNVEALWRFVRERQPRLVIEIGMAYGVSTIAILSGLSESGQGRLISIDPYLGWPTGRLVGLYLAARCVLPRFYGHTLDCS